MPMPSISCMRRLKYHERYAVRRMERPSGLSLRLRVRNSMALFMGIVIRPKSGGGICVIPIRLS